jgi:hypothetical protein
MILLAPAKKVQKKDLGAKGMSDVEPKAMKFTSVHPDTLKTLKQRQVKKNKQK